MKKYPDYSEFNPDEIIYGCHAPYVGMGVYTFDRKFSWPDKECTIKDEYDAWVKWLTDQGYEVPEEYKDAYVHPHPTITA
jgi:hypothetical protein